MLAPPVWRFVQYLSVTLRGIAGSQDENVALICDPAALVARRRIQIHDAEIGGIPRINLALRDANDPEIFATRAE